MGIYIYIVLEKFFVLEMYIKKKVKGAETCYVFPHATREGSKVEPCSSMDVLKLLYVHNNNNVSKRERRKTVHEKEMR